MGGAADIGRRIAEARKRLGLTKSGLGRAVGRKGKSAYRIVKKWEEEGQHPDPDSLARLTEVLGVTIEELMGVAAGQEPPFPAWGVFLAELVAEGDALSDDEARGLKSMVWPNGEVPTPRSYWALLSMLRTTLRPRA